jgi:hypothetical protein
LFFFDELQNSPQKVGYFAVFLRINLNQAEFYQLIIRGVSVRIDNYNQGK